MCQSDKMGEGISVGIADSVSTLPEELEERHDVTAFDLTSEYNNGILNRLWRLLPWVKKKETSHGNVVFDIIRHSSPKSTFYLYKILRSNGAAYGSNILKALKAAQQSDIDILHFSAGICPPEEGEIIKVQKEVNETIDKGITIIAAAGNESDVEEGCKNSLFYPACFERVIAVGGFVPKCHLRFEDILYQDIHKEPGPLWVDTSKINSIDENYQGPICNQRRCLTGESCHRINNDQWWDGNVRTTNEKPDVLAPIYYPAVIPEGCAFKSGTSFSAPFVTGQLAAILSDSSTSLLTPEFIFKGIRKSRVEINEREDYKFSARGLENTLP